MANEAVAAQPQEDVSRYINRLAALTSTPIRDWDIKTIFSNGQGGMLSDPADLNRVFFEQKVKAPAAEEETPFTFFKTHLEKLNVGNLDERIKIAEDNRKYHMNNAKERYDSIIASVNAARKEAENIRVLNLQKENPPDSTKQIKEVVGKGFWRLWQVHANSVDFVTVADVVLEHKNSAGGINSQINMGKYRVSYPMREGASVVVSSFHNNIGDRSMLHPHVFADGRICWGSATQMVIKMLVTNDVSGVMELTANILLQLNPADPVQGLHYFAGKKPWNTVEPHPPWLPRPGSMQVPKEDDLACEDTCSECEQHIDECTCEAAENYDEEPEEDV